MRGVLEARHHRISGLVVEYIVAIDVTRVRFPADAIEEGTRKKWKQCPVAAPRGILAGQ